VGAPVAAFAVPLAPTPVAPLNATTVSDWSKPETRPCVDVTVTLVSAAGATARQISAVPGRTFVRRTSVHVRPAPVTVAVWPEVGPSDPTNATSTSPAAVVLNGAVVCAFLPSLNTVASIAIPAARARR
jgi:hypothetical protein